jgi:PPM family protein phosphatase
MPLIDELLHDRALPVAGATDAGQRRNENQDTFLIAALSSGDDGVVLRPESAEADFATATLDAGSRGILLIVADGMGGAAAGRLASGLACSFVLAQLQHVWQDEPVTDADRFATCLQDAVEKANRRIHDHATRNPEHAGMGTTATVAGILGDVLVLAQVGDSRAYLIRGAVATPLTRDQTLVQQMIDAGAMTPEEAERSAHGNVILQALGVEAEVRVDLTRAALEVDDVLLLCSDGLYRVVRPGELVEAAQQLREPHVLCRELLALANARGAPDNVTVVAARVARASA